MAINNIVLQGDERFLFSKDELTDDEFLESLDMQPPAIKGKTEIEVENFGDEDKGIPNSKALPLQPSPFSDLIRWPS